MRIARELRSCTENQWQARGQSQTQYAAARPRIRKYGEQALHVVLEERLGPKFPERYPRWRALSVTRMGESVTAITTRTYMTSPQ